MEDLPFVLSIEEGIMKRSYHNVIFQKTLNSDTEAQVYTIRDERTLDELEGRTKRVDKEHPEWFSLHEFFAEEDDDVSIVENVDGSECDTCSTVVKQGVMDNVGDEIVISKGEVFMGGQEHFYFETNATQVEFRDNDVIVTSSTQGLSETQHFISHVCGIPLHKVHVRTARIGGGFGGKESRSCIFACYPVLAGLKYRRNCR